MPGLIAYFKIPIFSKNQGSFSCEKYSKNFIIVKKVSSSLNFLGTLFNLEVYFVVQKVAFDIS